MPLDCFAVKTFDVSSSVSKNNFRLRLRMASLTTHQGKLALGNFAGLVFDVSKISTSVRVCGSFNEAIKLAIII